MSGTEHGGYASLRELASPIGNGLVGQRQRITHGASGRLGKQPQRPRLRRNRLQVQHQGQMFPHDLRRHGAQIELQATAQHRGQHALRVGGGQDELQILRRLFQGFEQGVEGILGQLMRLVDHEDLVAAHRRLVGGPLDQVSDLVDAAVGSRVQLDVVHIAVCIDVLAGGTLPAGT